MKAKGSQTRMMDKAEGVVTFDAADYAPHAAEQIRAYFAETGRHVYYTGPLIPEGEEETSKDPRFDEIAKFLDAKLVSHGKGTVVYVRFSLRYMPSYLTFAHQISFGSMFWPMDNAKLWAVIDVLMERNIPFVSRCSISWPLRTLTDSLLPGHELRRRVGL